MIAFRRRHFCGEVDLSTIVVRRLAWLAPLLMIAAPVAAQDSVSSQINLGVLAHNVPILGVQKEHDVDLNGEILFVSPVPQNWTSKIAPRWRWLRASGSWSRTRPNSSRK